MRFGKKIANKLVTTVGEKSEIEDIMSVILSIQNISGNQILDPNWNWKRFLTSQVPIWATIVYVYFGTIEIIKTSDSPKLIAEAFYTFIFLISFPFKLLIFTSNRKIFLKLYLDVKTIMMDTIRNDSDDMLKDTLAKARKIANTGLFGMVCFPFTVYELAFAWNLISGQKETLSKATAILMPMETPYFELGWLLHTIYLFQMMFTIVVVDIWFILFLFIYCTTCDCTVKILEVEKLEDETMEEYSHRLNERLGKFYRIHAKQMEFLNLVSTMYKWLALVPLCNAAIAICMALLLVSEGVQWTDASNNLPMLAEIFAYNWFGEQVKTKASDLAIALVNFDWINLKMKNRKSYYIMVSYMNKEFAIKTAIGTELCLITMTSVLKFSYQTFTVLQTMQ